jgi:hypothetical protein
MHPSGRLIQIHLRADAVKALLKMRLHRPHIASLAQDLQQLVIGQKVEAARGTHQQAGEY